MIWKNRQLQFCPPCSPCREEAELQTFGVKKSDMETEISALSKEAAAQQFKHRESESALRKRLNKIENEVENWIAKYDSVCVGF